MPDYMDLNRSAAEVDMISIERPHSSCDKNHIGIISAEDAKSRGFGQALQYCRGYVYTISDPRTDVVVYVGHSFDPAGRKKTHLGGNDPVTGRFVREIKSLGLLPVFSVVECTRRYTPCDYLNVREREWIKFCASPSLLNKRHNPLAGRAA